MGGKERQGKGEDEWGKSCSEAERGFEEKGARDDGDQLNVMSTKAKESDGVDF